MGASVRNAHRIATPAPTAAIAAVIACCGGAAQFAPASAQTRLEVLGSIPGPAEHVRVSGTHAYVVAGPRLSVIDVGDPALPKARGSFTFAEPIYGIAVSGAAVHVANGVGGLAILDVSDPDAPRLLGSLKTRGVALRVAVAGTKAVVGDRTSGIEVIDASNPSRPVLLGTHYTSGYVTDVAASGPLAYIVDASTDLSVIDVSKSGPPDELGVQESSHRTDIVATASAGGSTAAPALVCIAGGGLLQVYDVSDPSAPRKVSTYKVPERTTGQARRATGAQRSWTSVAGGLAFDGSLAYVASGTEGLHIVDVSDPARPNIIASHKAEGPARDVAVAGQLVFVVVGESKAPPGSDADAPNGGVVILRRKE
jgi:hypothetical protein